MTLDERTAACNDPVKLEIMQMLTKSDPTFMAALGALEIIENAPLIIADRPVIWRDNIRIDPKVAADYIGGINDYVTVVLSLRLDRLASSMAELYWDSILGVTDPVIHECIPMRLILDKAPLDRNGNVQPYWLLLFDWGFYIRPAE